MGDDSLLRLQSGHPMELQRTDELSVNKDQDVSATNEGHMSFAHRITSPNSSTAEEIGMGGTKGLLFLKGLALKIFGSKSESAAKPLQERHVEVLGKKSMIDSALSALGFNRKEPPGVDESHKKSESVEVEESIEVESSSQVGEPVAEGVVSGGESISKLEVKAPAAKLENFTNEFKDENGRVVAKETAIRNTTVERKINGMESKLERMKADLASLKEIDSSTLELMGNYHIVPEVLEDSQKLMQDASKELERWTQLRRELGENVEEMQRNPNRVENEFQLYRDNIARLKGYNQEKALTDATNKFIETNIKGHSTDDPAVDLLAKEAGTLIPTFIRLSDELKSEKQKELNQLKSDPDTLYGSAKSSRITALNEEIAQLGKYEFSPHKLVEARVETLEGAIEKTEIELATFKSEVEQTNATHGTTNTPRYRFQFIKHRELATKTKAELSKIADKASVEELQTLLKDIGEIEGLKPPVLDSSAAKDKKKIETFRKEVETYLIAARDKVIPQYIEEFKVSKENGTPVLINSQLQTVGKPGGSPASSIGRSGAISDFAHGEVSLQELKDYQNLQLLEKKGIREDSSEAKQLMSLYDLQTDGKLDRAKLSDLVLTIKAKAILSYGGENILEKHRDSLSMKNLWTGDSSLRLAMQNLVKKNKLSSISDEDRSAIKAALVNAEIDISKLHEISNKREQNLAGLVLQDLEMHFENHKVDGQKATYARVGLLDMAKSAKNEYGSIFNERTQGLDTMAALNFLDGKKIVFDVEEGGGSFIHPDGSIHMPAKCKTGDLTEATLSTVFLNVSVQGNVKNSGLQRSVNEAGLKKLEQLGIPEGEIKQIKKSLNKISGKVAPLLGDANKTARQMIQSINGKGGYVSVNCYGGKDRTGALLALLSKTALKEVAPKAYEKKVDDWKKQLTSEEGVMAQVAKANAGHTVVKTMAPNTALFGTLERLRHYLGAAKLGAAAAKGIAQESDAEGQLFKVEGAKSYKFPKVK